MLVVPYDRQPVFVLCQQKKGGHQMTGAGAIVHRWLGCILLLYASINNHTQAACAAILQTINAASCDTPNCATSNFWFPSVPTGGDGVGGTGVLAGGDGVGGTSVEEDGR
jgi:hypothetical protein